MHEFRKLGIEEYILKAIQEKNIFKPTPIQLKTIPLTISGKDVIAGSATGSGKTLAFGIGIIQKSEKGKGIQSLILTPTRELAEQIKKELRKLSKNKPLEIVTVYGGLSIEPQIKNLKNADIVVGTPGRMLDHIGRRSINLDNVKILVLDEADRMLDMGFIDDVEKIIRKCPRDRQTLLFSATIGTDLGNLAKRYMKNPVKISVDNMVDPKKLKQIYYDIHEDNLKFSLLVHLLKGEKTGLVMVFCNSRKTTDFIANNLKNTGIDATAIHGGFSQEKRNRVMDKFHSKNAHVLVCTDVVARGLDIKGISHIYNYDIPKESKQYIHRIGRTARAGKKGIAISILSRRDYSNFAQVQRDTACNIERRDTPYIKRVRITWREETRPFRKNYR